MKSNTRVCILLHSYPFLTYCRILLRQGLQSSPLSCLTFLGVVPSLSLLQSSSPSAPSLHSLGCESKNTEGLVYIVTSNNLGGEYNKKKHLETNSPFTILVSYSVRGFLFIYLFIYTHIILYMHWVNRIQSATLICLKQIIYLSISQSSFHFKMHDLTFTMDHILFSLLHQLCYDWLKEM